MASVLALGSQAVFAYKDKNGNEITQWKTTSGNWKIGEQIVSLVPDPRLPTRADFQVVGPHGAVVRNFTSATHGIMVVMDKNNKKREMGLVSKAIGPSLDIRNIFRAKKADAKFNHVEVHAAALLNNISENEALLMINYEAGACTSCLQNIHRYLKKGKTLYVVWRSYDGWIDEDHHGVKFVGQVGLTMLSEWPAEYKMEDFGIPDNL